MQSGTALQQTAEQTALRKALERIITTEAVRFHVAQIEQLAAKHPGAELKPQPPAPGTAHAYNCFMHVLSLVGRLEPNVVQSSLNEIRFLVDSVFFRKLYEAGILTETSESDLQPQDLVVYYQGRHKRHVGRYLGPNRIESKWGIGPLMHHGLWDLPWCYGQTLRFFKPPSQDRVDAFVRQQLPLVTLAPAGHR